MEKKSTIFCLIIVAVLVISAGAFIIFTGITAGEYNYVQLEINPRIEFLCNKNFKVTSCRALNDDARILLAGVDYKGMDIEDASTNFLELCAQTGYLDVNGVDNAINITVIDGITQALDTRVTKSIFEYLKKSEILCTVVENYEIRKIADEKKEKHVPCSNKLKLIKTIQEYEKNMSLESLKKLSEEALIDMVNNIHSKHPNLPTESDLKMKEKLLLENQEKYTTHMNGIWKDSQKEFSKLISDHQKQSSKEYLQDFDKEYNNWQNDRIS